MRVTEISELKVETTNWPCEGVGWGVASAAEAIVSSLTPLSCRRGERESNTTTQEDHRTYPKPGKEKKSKYPNFYVPVQNEVALWRVHILYHSTPTITPDLVIEDGRFYSRGTRSHVRRQIPPQKLQDHGALRVVTPLSEELCLKSLRGSMSRFRKV